MMKFKDIKPNWNIRFCKNTLTAFVVDEINEVVDSISVDELAEHISELKETYCNHLYNYQYYDLKEKKQNENK